jgi:hypothetical protein
VTAAIVTAIWLAVVANATALAKKTAADAVVAVATNKRVII